MDTDADIVEGNMRSQQCMHRFQRFDPQSPTGDLRLVGDSDQEKASALQPPASLRSIRKNLKI